MKTKKRVYVALMVGSTVFLGLLNTLAWVLPRYPWSRTILVLLTISSIAFIAVVGFSVVELILALWRQFQLHPLVSGIINFLFPLALFLGQILSINRDVVRSSFIEVNNQLVRLRHLKKLDPQKILLLIPHCLQRSECNQRITTDINNCRRCGRCVISSLRSLAEKYRVNIAVATGGNLARQLVYKYKPQAIIAIACERDLASGIHDVGTLPVLGIVNSRPFGPCANTTVDTTQVEEALKCFTT